jgi:DNA-binding FrmR family transcriptional regulator
MEKRSCCCSGEDGTMNINMETGTEAAENAAAADAGDDAVCHCRHKHRTEKEEKDLLNRLSRIEGQVRGIKAMVQDERYCPDILVQVSAVQSALNGFCKVLLSNHIKTCVVEDIRNGNEETAVAELCETIKKMM